MRASAALALAGLLLLPAMARGQDVPSLQRISFGPAGGNGAFDVGFRGATPDLGGVLCETSEALTADDTDDNNDLYTCAGAATRRQTVGQGSLGNAPQSALTTNIQGVWISDDGTQVVFSTNEALEPGDTDNVAAGNQFPDGQYDVYKRANGTTTRLSTGPGDNNGNIIVDVLAMSADGNRALLQTNGGTLIDEPGFIKGVHLFIRDQSAGTTTRVNAKEIGDPAYFAGGNHDLTRVFWVSDANEAGDTDDRLDLFQWQGGTITQLSPGPTGPAGFTTTFGDASPDGTRVVFQTDKQLLPADTDSRADVYAAQNGVLELLSTGPTGGNGDRDARLAGMTPDGSHVFFTTSENLTADDTDTGNDEGTDLYERFGGATTLLSPGPADGNTALASGGTDRTPSSVSADGGRAIIATDVRLSPQDTDTASDLYAVSGGVATLLSTGPSGGNGAIDARYLGASADMSAVVFSTPEKLTPDDLDARSDVYVRSGGVTTRLSGTPGTGNGNFDATVPADFTRASGHPGLGAVSADGSKVLIQSSERLTPDDTDNNRDLFISTHTPAVEPTPTPTPTPSPTPAPAASPPSPVTRPAPLPAITKVVVFPSTRVCASRRKFGIRLRVPRGLKALSATVFVNGKRVAVRRGSRLRSTVDLRGLPKGRFTVKITIKLADGRKISGARKYHTCVKARRKHKPPKV